MKQVTKWNIYNCNLGEGEGCEQGGVRPVLIVQNNVGNRCSPTTIIVPITSRNKTDLPTHFTLRRKEYDFLLYENNVALCEQVRVIDKNRILSLIGKLKTNDIPKVEKCLKVNFDF